MMFTNPKTHRTITDFFAVLFIDILLHCHNMYIKNIGLPSKHTHTLPILLIVHFFNSLQDNFIAIFFFQNNFCYI